ncbi:MAG: DUF1570 domain-containing protein [Lentisphaerae bacterium]|nr:DUF1570 domain-containing protein [Lentisphaerota bacterium]
MGRCVLLALLLANSLCWLPAWAEDSQGQIGAAAPPRFVLQGVDSPELSQAILQELCQAWADADALLRGERSQIVKPLVVEVSFTRKRFSLPGLPSRWEEPAGCVYLAKGYAVLRLDQDLSQRSRQIIRHEVAHWLLWLYWAEEEPLPTWLNEGVACLMEMPFTPEGRPQLQLERRRQFLQLCKRRKSAVRLERLLSAERSQAFLSSHEYAFAWALAFYLASRESAEMQGGTALIDLLQANLDARSCPDHAQCLQQSLFQLVKPPVASCKELLRQIEGWMSGQWTMDASGH